jgi:deoxyribodipyrimidine photo-lyase
MIDACMRALHQHGWINFRMRAMLMSFSSYQLWLHWKKPAVFLARHFLDFEPGIHYSQAQMQSGVTGINTIRIYSPAKQQVDQDPQGKFIRDHLPELSFIPDADLAEPHKMPPLLQISSGFRIGIDYPEPIVDPVASYQTAKQRIFEWKARDATQKAAKKVVAKHTS